MTKKINKRLGNISRRKVILCDVMGEQVEEFNSLTKCADFLGKSRQFLNNRLRNGNRVIGKYTVRYKNRRRYDRGLVQWS
jgi:hypothetical protein